MTKSKLVVEVISAHNLMPKDSKGSSSAFVELHYEEQRFCTTTKEKDLNPVWNEKFYFNISNPDNLHDIDLHVKVYHHTKGTPTSSRSFLGQFWLTATTFVHYSHAEVVYYNLEKRGFFSSVRGELGLKVGIIVDDDEAIKPSTPLYPVLTNSQNFVNYEAKFNSSGDLHSTRVNYEEYVSSYHRHNYDSSDPLVSPRATKFGIDKMKHESLSSLNLEEPVFSHHEAKDKDDVMKPMMGYVGVHRGVGDFFVVIWQQASSTVKIILMFAFTWFQHLLFLIISLILGWSIRHKNKKQNEVPNMMIRLKLTIDKEKNRVLYAESDQDFVDILLGFLTLPMGTIIRLAQKKSRIGCLDNLYTSVENLDDKILQTKACRTMLLNPINPYQILCNNLIVNIDKSDSSKHYICSKFLCWCVNQNENKIKLIRLASAVKDSECICGRAMDKEVYVKNILQQKISNESNNGVFFSKTQSFFITDDLCITPSPTSLSDCHEMIQNLRAGDIKNIEDMVITIGTEEVMQLLKNSFLSNTPMTNTFLLKEQDVDNDVELFQTQSNLHVNPNVIPTNFIKLKNENLPLIKKVKLLIDKSSNKVLCLEADEDLLDNVLSFLTFPLGYMLKILTGHSCSLGSITNVYSSVEKLDLTLCKYRDTLLNPNLAPYFSCENQMLDIEEEDLASFTATRDHKYNLKKLCSSWFYKKIRIMNPKLSGQVRKGGTGGYVKKSSSLLIYDDLVIRPCSTTTGIFDLFRNNIQVNDIKIQEVEVGGNEVLALLVSSLTCKNALNSVFRQS